MITKERLEELIKEGATIWGVADYTYHESKPYKRMEYFDLRNTLTFYNNNIDEFLEMNYHIEFFETKEEAEWYMKFGNITRTETLSLPTWEEISMGGEYNDLFTTPNNRRILFLISYDEYFNGSIFVDDTLYGGKKYYDKPLTKENYLEACEICRELFLGEEV